MLAPKWDIDTRNVNNVPREYEDLSKNVFFNLAIFSPTASSAATLTAAACTTDNADTPDDYETVTATATDGLSGFEVEGAPIERLGFDRNVYLCVQADSNADANDADKGAGPWTISSAFSVAKPTTSLSSSVADGASPGQATITIKNWNKAWYYSSSPDRDDNLDTLQCDPVGADTDEAPFFGTANTSYTVTAWDNATCDGNKLATKTGIKTKQ